MNEQTDIALPDMPGIEPGWEVLTVEADRAAGKFTAERLAGNAQRRDAVVRALAEGMSIAGVARAFGMSRNTVATAYRRFGPQIEQRKQEVGGQALDVARMAIERIRDEIDDMPKASLPIIAGIMIDKAQLLSGAPTVRIEHSSAASGPSGFNDWLGSLVDVTPSTSVASGETLGQKAMRSGGVSDKVTLEAGASEQVASVSGDVPSPAFVPALIGESVSEGANSGQKGGAA